MKFFVVSFAFALTISTALSEGGFAIPQGYRLVPINNNYYRSSAVAVSAPGPAAPNAHKGETFSTPILSKSEIHDDAGQHALGYNNAGAGGIHNNYYQAPSAHLAGSPAAPVSHKSEILSAPILGKSEIHDDAGQQALNYNNAAGIRKNYYQPPLAPLAAGSAASGAQQGETLSTPTLSKSEYRDDSGQYALSYITSDGIRVSERSYLKESKEGYVPVKEGTYEYTSPEGTPVSYGYKADENGFVVKGYPLPLGAAQIPTRTQ